MRVLVELSAVPANARARGDRERIVRAEYEARWRSTLGRHPMTAEMLGAELARLAPANNVSDAFRDQAARDLEGHPTEAADAFVALPSETQWLLLQSSTVWPSLAKPWIVPALQRVYDKWDGRPTTGTAPTPAGDLALTRLYGLAPEQGRQAILQEIRSGAHGIGYDALAILPEADLPELDTALQARYSAPRRGATQDNLAERGTAAWLLARYGSSTLVPFVTNAIARPLPGCFVEGGLLAYLLKHDPPAAMARLGPGFDRTKRGTCVMPLDAVAQHYWDDRVESAVIASLTTTDTRHVVEAAQLLGVHGSRAAKAPMIDRLAQWSSE